MTSSEKKCVGRRGILVVHPGAVGDVLLARPVLHVLRRRFPQHEVALLAGQAVGLVLRDGGEIDRIFPLESTYLTELFAGSNCLHPAFRTWLGTCDVAVGWLQDTEGAIADTLRTPGVQCARFKSASSPDLLSEHQAARYLEAMEVQGVSLPDISHPLVLSPSVRERGRQILQKFNWINRQRLVVIHPGSGSASKCIDAVCFARVIELLCREGITPVLLEGPSDREPVAHVLAAATIAVGVIRGLDLSTAAAVLSHADLYLGNDSGMTHLAAALSIPTIACFGPTNPRRWAPLGQTVSVLTGGPCVCPTWSSVERCADRVCLHISSERISEACRSLLLRRSATLNS